MINGLNQISCVNIHIKYSYKVNHLIQFRWLLWRSNIAALRDPFATTFAIIQTFVKYLNLVQ